MYRCGKLQRKAEQIEAVMKCVTKENYAVICQRVKKLADSDEKLGSSNFYGGIKYFADENVFWINTIYDKLE